MVTFEGSRNNNIVWDLHGASVFVDESAPPERRFFAAGLEKWLGRNGAAHLERCQGARPARAAGYEPCAAVAPLRLARQPWWAFNCT